MAALCGSQPPPPPTLQFQCVSLLLRSAASFDDASRAYLSEVLVATLGVDGLIPMLRDAACFAGLAYLPARDDLSLIDAIRARLAERPKTARKTLEAASSSLTSPVAADAHRVAGALLCDGRFKKDISGPTLPKAVADQCRRLRNMARDGMMPAEPQPRRPPRDLRPLRNGHPTRGPWFPGYEH